MNNESKNENYIGIEQVAKAFGVRSATAREWAKHGLLPGHKVGKKWFFWKRTIYGRQGEHDAALILNGIPSRDRHYDVLVGNKRIEVKSSKVCKTKTGIIYWSFSGFRTGSDAYILLGYNKDRSKLMNIYYIPTKELSEHLDRNPIGYWTYERTIRVNLGDKFFESYRYDKSNEVNNQLLRV